MYIQYLKYTGYIKLSIAHGIKYMLNKYLINEYMVEIGEMARYFYWLFHELYEDIKIAPGIQEIFVK